MKTLKHKLITEAVEKSNWFNRNKTGLGIGGAVAALGGGIAAATGAFDSHNDNININNNDSLFTEPAKKIDNRSNFEKEHGVDVKTFIKNQGGIDLNNDGNIDKVEKYLFNNKPGRVLKTEQELAEFKQKYDYDHEKKKYMANEILAPKFFKFLTNGSSGVDKAKDILAEIYKKHPETAKFLETDPRYLEKIGEKRLSPEERYMKIEGINSFIDPKHSKDFILKSSKYFNYEDSNFDEISRDSLKHLMLLKNSNPDEYEKFINSEDFKKNRISNVFLPAYIHEKINSLYQDALDDKYDNKDSATHLKNLPAYVKLLQNDSSKKFIYNPQFDKVDHGYTKDFQQSNSKTDQIRDIITQARGDFLNKYNFDNNNTNLNPLERHAATYNITDKNEAIKSFLTSYKNVNNSPNEAYNQFKIDKYKELRSSMNDEEFSKYLKDLSSDEKNKLIYLHNQIK